MSSKYNVDKLWCECETTNGLKRKANHIRNIPKAVHNSTEIFNRVMLNRKHLENATFFLHGD